MVALESVLHGAHVVGEFVTRSDLNDAGKIGDGPIVVAFACVGTAAGPVGTDGLRICLDGPAEVGDFALAVAFLPVGEASANVRADIPWIDLDGLAAVGDTEVVVALERVGVAAVNVGDRILRIDLQRLREVGDRPLVVGNGGLVLAPPLVDKAAADVGPAAPQVGIGIRWIFANDFAARPDRQLDVLVLLAVVDGSRDSYRCAENETEAGEGGDSQHCGAQPFRQSNQLTSVVCRCVTVP